MNKVQKLAMSGLAALGLCLGAAPGVLAQSTGVSDDRVSLPEGPGSLEGVGENVEMDPNMGVMRYGVQIKVPQGFAGVTPQLRLAYSSGNGGSVVGMGWTMEVPCIERMTYRGLPEYTTDDDFSANGSMQLVALPETTPPTYRARYEKGFERYRWHDAGEGGEGYWTVEYPDGRVGYFGARADGTLVDSARVGYEEGTFRYMLVEMVDVYGHKAVYSYQKYGNVALLRNVGYVFTTNPEMPRYSVSLSYEERMDDTGFDYLSNAKGGFNELLTQRLSAVNIFSGAERIRRYELSYERYAESGGFTRLRGVAMLGLENDTYPIAHTFGYSQALGGVCDEAECDQPFVVEMGNIGVNVSVGRATLLDINGDSLPDLLNTSDDGPHTFLLNTPTEDGSSSFAETPITSAVNEATGSGFRLGTRYVQVLDVNGDGFTDMLHAQNGRVLINRGNGDWEMTMTATGNEEVAGVLGSDFDIEEGELRSVRFLDYDNDKRIDLMRSTRTETSIYRNLGMDGFVEDETIDLLGYGIQADGVQFTDMNGDGLLDPVKLNVGGLRYKLNLGWGRWSEEVEVLGLPIEESELSLAALEDLNGDGLSDLVIVVGSNVKYAINRNGTEFSDITTLTSNDTQGAIPQRDGTVTVLFADMNGNGSLDPVWLSSEGDVTYLELFPVRPNQLSRIENGIGMVTEVTYGTSVQHMARDGGWEAWQYRLPHPMLVVDQVDRYDLLTNIHEVTEYSYHDGFYDGVEKQFRGYARVEKRLIGDDAQEGGLTLQTYDVGATDPYTNGLLLTESVDSAGRPLYDETHVYDECPLEGIPAGTSLPIKYICEVERMRVVKEGAEDSEWATVETRMEYDGYGNVARDVSLGVTALGGQGCAPCERDPSEFGAPCGAQCVGDEMYTETEYVEPGEDTSDRWILRSPYREVTYGRPGSPTQTETLTYYDEGETPFAGMALGQLDQGRVTRVTRKIDEGSDGVITQVRNRYDDHGNVIETIDPNGEPGGNTHRRLYSMDEDKLRVVQTDILLEDPEGQPYRLRREVQYERVFDKVVENTAWMRVVGEQVVSGRRSTSYAYDQYARLVAKALPGEDTIRDPTERYVYDLSSPTSRIITQRRSRPGGAFDLETIRCLDGKGREVQERKRLESGLYQVDGFKQFNARDQARRLYQPYTSPSADCDEAPPEGTLYTRFRRDSTNRVIEQELADASIYGEASMKRIVYLPLGKMVYDGEDSDAAGPHFDTPLVTRIDGQDRKVSLERWLTPMGPPAVLAAHYDELGRLSGYTDADGNRKEQVYDLLGRVVRVSDPNTEGDNTYTYDDVGQVVSMTDGRGVTTESRYDGANRLIARWDAADRDGTLIEQRYDAAPDCEPTVCANAEGMLAEVTYPGLDGERAIEHLGYDARSRGVFRARTIGGFTFAFETAFDNADRHVGTTFPTGRTIARSYDDASRLVGVDGVIGSVSYDERGQRVSMERADGSVNTVSYDAVMRVEELVTLNGDGEVAQGFAYTRDRAGNVVATEDMVDGGLNFDADFTYDAWYRLVSAELSTGTPEAETLGFEYDRIDNILSRSSSRPNTTAYGNYTYDGHGPNAVSSFAGIGIEYDRGGYMSRKGDIAMAWDFQGRLTQAGPGGTARFVYGHDQTRVARYEGDSLTLYPTNTFVVRDGISSIYVKMDKMRLARLDDTSLAPLLLSDVAPLDAPDDEINAADAWIAYAAEQALIASVGDTDPTGRLLMSSVRRMLVETGSAEVQLHSDHQGSLTLATADGQVVGERSFAPRGAVREQAGYVGEYGFTGQEMDRATQLVRFDYRYYDPQIGRWISTDPMFNIIRANKLAVFGESSTAYAYVANNFATGVDPTGLCKACGKPGKLHKSRIHKLGAQLKHKINPTTHFSAGQRAVMRNVSDGNLGSVMRASDRVAMKVENAVSANPKLARGLAIGGQCATCIRAVVTLNPITLASTPLAVSALNDAVRANMGTPEGVRTVAAAIPLGGTVYSAISATANNARKVLQERINTQITSFDKSQLKPPPSGQ